MALPLNFADLTLGTTIEIPHIDSDNLRIKVPPGSNPGETISIPGRGLPFSNHRARRGSVTVVLRLQSPTKPSRKLKKKIEEIRVDEGRSKIKKRALRKITPLQFLSNLLEPLL